MLFTLPPWISIAARLVSSFFLLEVLFGPLMSPFSERVVGDRSLFSTREKGNIFFSWISSLQSNKVNDLIQLKGVTKISVNNPINIYFKKLAQYLESYRPQVHCIFNHIHSIKYM